MHHSAVNPQEIGKPGSQLCALYLFSRLLTIYRTYIEWHIESNRKSLVRNKNPGKSFYYCLVSKL